MIPLVRQPYASYALYVLVLVIVFMIFYLARSRRERKRTERNFFLLVKFLNGHYPEIKKKLKLDL